MASGDFLFDAGSPKLVFYANLVGWDGKEVQEGRVSIGTCSAIHVDK